MHAICIISVHRAPELMMTGLTTSRTRLGLEVDQWESDRSAYMGMLAVLGRLCGIYIWLCSLYLLFHCHFIKSKGQYDVDFFKLLPDFPASELLTHILPCPWIGKAGVCFQIFANKQTNWSNIGGIIMDLSCRTCKDSERANHKQFCLVVQGRLVSLVGRVNVASFEPRTYQFHIHQRQPQIARKPFAENNGIVVSIDKESKTITHCIGSIVFSSPSLTNWCTASFNRPVRIRIPMNFF